MNSKKASLSFMILCLSVIFFTGCQSTENSTDQATSQNTATEESPASSDTYTLSQLMEFDGINGEKCLVAVSGIVYDVTASDEWENGVHKDSNGQATCGEDLTSVINSSPHGRSVLTSSPDVVKVGELN